MLVTEATVAEESEREHKEEDTHEDMEVGGMAGIPISWVCIDGKKAQLVWDHCATRPYMSAAFAKANGIVIQPRGGWIRVGSIPGKAIEPAAVAEATVVMEDGGVSVSFGCEFQVLETWGHSADAIMGKSMLNVLARKYGWKLDTETNEITMRAEGGRTLRLMATAGRPLECEPTKASWEEVVLLTEGGGMAQPPEQEPPEVAELMREFADVFTGEFTGPRAALPVEAVLELKEGRRPPLNRPWRCEYSQIEGDFLTKKVEDMCEKSQVEECERPLLLGTIFPVEKPDSTPEDRKFRLVHDLRVCNQYSEQRVYPQDRIEDLVNLVAQKRFVSIIDVSEAFFQVGVTEQDRDFFAFYTPQGRCMRFKVLPMGWTNSPFYWSQNMSQIFKECRDFLRFYVDDIAVYSDTLEEHLDHLRRVLSIMRKFHLKANGKKVQLIKQDGVRFLGHWLKRGVVAPIVDKAVIRAWRAPSNRAEVKSYLGLFNYYRSFVAGAAEMTAALDAVAAPKQKFVWAEAQEAAFRATKDALLKCEGLGAFSHDPAVPTRLLVDASQVAVGGALEQQRADGKWVTVGLFSKRMTPVKSMRSAIHREAYGVLLNLRHFKRLLRHREFTLFTDCKPLFHALRAHEPSDARWQMLLSELLSFRVKLALVAGKENTLADECSRYPWAPKEVVDTYFSPGEVVLAVETEAFEITAQEWEAAYEKDRRCNAIVTELRKSSTASLSYFAGKYEMRESKLYLKGRSDDQHDRLVVPEGLVAMFLHQYHDGHLFGGHAGTTATYLSLREKFYFHKMFEVVKEYVASCRVCARTKSGHVALGPPHPLPIPSHPFQGLSMDFVGGFPTVQYARRGVMQSCDSIFVITCLLSRMVCLVPVEKGVSAEDCIQILIEEVFMGQQWGMPRYIVCDNDVRFRAKAFQSACERLRIELCMSTTHHPETDGATEVKNRQVLSILRSYCAAEPSSWPSKLIYVAWNINTAISRTTGRAPLEVVYGRNPRMDWPTEKRSGEIRALCKRLDEVCLRREVAVAAAFDTLTGVRDDYVLTEYPARAPAKLEVGDKVYVNTEVLLPVEFREQKHKLVPRYCGPFAIEKVVGSGAYRLDLPATSRAKRTVNAEYLKKWVPSRFPHPAGREIPVTSLGDNVFETEGILRHFISRKEVSFEVKWFGFEETTIEPLACFTDSKGRLVNEHVKEYVAVHKVELPSLD